MDFVLQASINHRNKIEKIEKLNITPVELDINLINFKHHGMELEHHNYPTDKPILVEKKDDYYSIIDGNHRYKQALDLGKLTILSKIYVKT